MSSFGEVLKRERELREISLREISEATKISLRYLEALERDDFRYLPGGVFNKGFVRAYAQFIGVDPETMVTAYLHEEQTQDARTEHHKLEAFRRSNGGGVPPTGARSTGAEAPLDHGWPRWVLASAILVLLALLTLAGLALMSWVRDRTSPRGAAANPFANAPADRPASQAPPVPEPKSDPGPEGTHSEALSTPRGSLEPRQDATPVGTRAAAKPGVLR